MAAKPTGGSLPLDGAWSVIRLQEVVGRHVGAEVPLALQARWLRRSLRSRRSLLFLLPGHATPPHNRSRHAVGLIEHLVLALATDRSAPRTGPASSRRSTP